MAQLCFFAKNRPVHGPTPATLQGDAARSKRQDHGSQTQAPSL
ncbi:hypothetical protein [Prochlorothrix hollandica]